MTVMVTGSAGFVGRAVVDALLRNTDDQILCIDQNDTGQDADPRVAYHCADLGDEDVIAELFSEPCEKIIHLAAVPGGQSEANPKLSQCANLNVPLALMSAAAQQAIGTRFVFASSIAVFGGPLPQTGLDDSVPASPLLVYGMHKAMTEIAVGTNSRRGAIEGVSLRLPAIVARPPGPSGLKSAFLSEIFYALENGEPYVMPVSAQATTWLLSDQQCANVICRASQIDLTDLPPERVVNVPALHVSIEQLVAAIARELGVSTDHVTYQPDVDLEAAFGAYPALSTPLADSLGFTHDTTLQLLVARVFGRNDRAIH